MSSKNSDRYVAPPKKRKQRDLNDRYNQVAIEDYRTQRLNEILASSIQEERHQRQVEENIDMEYASSDDNLPGNVKRSMKKRDKDTFFDVEPRWRAQDPRKRMSWAEFIRDFMGQNYGAIAQDLLMMHNSDDPGLKVQFMKFMMEMGKQGNPQSMQVDLKGDLNVKSDIYAQLQAMSRMSEPGQFPSAGPAPQIDGQQMLQEGQDDDMPAVDQQDDIYASWNSQYTVDNPFASDEEQEEFYRDQQ